MGVAEALNGGDGALLTDEFEVVAGEFTNGGDF